MAVLSSIPGLSEALNAINQGSRDGAVNEDGSIRQSFVELPMDQELRVEIVDAQLKTSQAGNEGVRYTLEVVEPAEFKGGKVWDSIYFTGQAFQGQRLAVLLASAGAAAATLDEAVKAIIGGKLVIALKPGNDPRYPDTRWTNLDQGQKLRTSIPGPKPKATPIGLTADTGVGALIAQQTPVQTAVTVSAPDPVRMGQVGVSAAPVVTQAAPEAPAPAQPNVPLPGMGGGIKLPGT
jgi:hypothetical protein